MTQDKAHQSNLPAQTSTQRTANTPAALVREKSTSALTQAIHSPGDDEYVLHRTRTCLKLYYDPEMSVEDRADMIESYRRALGSKPKWAVAKAFDEWERTGTRRPSPADLNILAGKAMKVITDELAQRKRNEAAPEPTVERTDDERAAGLHALQSVGFTPKRFEAVRRKPMASSEAELYAQSDLEKQPHWADVAAPDGPEMQALRKARAENTLMQFNEKETN